MMQQPTVREPLRLLLVADGETIPSWLFKCLTDVQRSRAAEIVLVVQPTREDVRGSSMFLQRGRQFLFWWYRNLDRYLFRTPPDALAPINLRTALPPCRVIDGAGLEGAPWARALEAEQVDVVLDPFSLIPDRRLVALSKYGVWSMAFGRPDDPRTQSTPAFWEVVEGKPSTETRLCIDRTGSGKVALYVSVAPTDRRSVSRSQNHLWWKLSAALAGKIQRLWEDPDRFFQRLGSASLVEGTGGKAPPPGNLDMVRAGARLIRRYVADRWRSTRYREQWALAYQRGAGDRLVMEAFQPIVPPRDRIWADPFPIEVGNLYYVFHEELLRSTGRGTIVLTILDDQGPVAPPVPVLDQDCHLAYPFVFRWDGDLFMVPETASRHQVELYRCVGFPLHWKLERVLLSGRPARDATLARMFETWWLFANIPAYGAGTSDELHLFYADSPLGPWTPHGNNPIKSDVRSARPAGRIFEHRGHFYRPAQDCSRYYGYGVSVNRIVRLDPEVYEEIEERRFIPNWSPRVIGVHTLNAAGDLTMIDCLIRRNRAAFF